jgi:ATP-dependent RNA helicase RhlE
MTAAVTTPGRSAAKRRFRPRGNTTTGQHRNKVRRVV